MNVDRTVVVIECRVVFEFVRRDLFDYLTPGQAVNELLVW